jgi:pimeloyl-ACP methyl ester carboxylesterase
LRTPAKKLTERLPHLTALSLDIRGHGSSASHPAPHTFQSCTQDVIETLQPLGLVDERSPVAICGHSLGGRIALQYSHDLQQSSFNIRSPKQTWILDSVPGTPDPSVHSVIKAISSIPLPVTSKTDLSKTLKEEYNFNKTIAMWMASNLKPADGGFEWVFDLDIANELLSNFAKQNFHEMIEVVAKEQDVHLVTGGKNREWTDSVVDALRSIPRQPADRFQMHKLEEAGHWVHTDDLEGLLDLMVGALDRT